MYNNKTYPNTKIDNVSEMFNQTLKCFNSKKSSLSLTHYTNNVLGGGNDDYLANLAGGEFIAPIYTYIKKFVGGIPLQRYYTDDKHFTGLDISKNSLSINIDLASTSYTALGVKTVTPQAIPNGLFVVLQSYCVFDVSYHIKDGEIYVNK